jgi:hypothetical protein
MSSQLEATSSPFLMLVPGLKSLFLSAMWVGQLPIQLYQIHRPSVEGTGNGQRATVRPFVPSTNQRVRSLVPFGALVLGGV